MMILADSTSLEKWQKWWQTFEFANWMFLLGLAAIPLIIILRGKRHGASALGYSSTSILASLGRRRGGREGIAANVLVCLAVASLVLALARPRLAEQNSVQLHSGVDIMLVLDVSGSMQAMDYTIEQRRARRIDAVQKVTREFIEKREHDRIGIVQFANTAHLVSPLTMNHDWLLRSMRNVRVGPLGKQTAIGTAIGSGAARLEDLKSKSRIMVLLTDGENTAGEVKPTTAAEAAAATGIKIYTIGIGTPGGGNSAIIPRTADGFDEETLEEIARVTDGIYQRAEGTESLQRVLDEIDRLEKTEVEVKNFRKFEDLFQWPLLLGISVLGTFMLLENTLWRRLP